MKKKLQLCFVDAKVRRVLAISKYLGNIFIELLRRGGIEATKGNQRPKSCRMSKENGGSAALRQCGIYVIGKGLWMFSKALSL